MLPVSFIKKKKIEISPNIWHLKQTGNEIRMLISFGDKCIITAKILAWQRPIFCSTKMMQMGQASSVGWQLRPEVCTLRNRDSFRGTVPSSRGPPLRLEACESRGAGRAYREIGEHGPLRNWPPLRSLRQRRREWVKADGTGFALAAEPMNLV